MDYTTLIGLAFVCAMGAMSPGPSLAVVLRNTISGGRLQGVMTGVGHGIGFGIYALIAVTGLSALLLAHESIFTLLQWGGALVLLWLSYNMLTYVPTENKEEHSSSGRKGFIEGFLISFFNPKILVFFVAVFSQFMNPQISKLDRFIMAGIAGTIDMTWYVFVAIALAGTSFIKILKNNAILIDRLVGSILMIYSVLLIVNILIW